MTPAALLDACRSAAWRGGPGDALVFAADLDREVVPEHDWLDPHERARAARFVTPELQRRHAATRTVLRALLSAATGRPPGELELALDANGKPRLADPQAHVHFNVSHSGPQLRIALGGDVLGVDIEGPGSLRDPDTLAASVLDSADLARWAAAPAESRRERLLRAWVAKEAVLKASGEGLAQDPRAVAVPECGSGPARLANDARTFWVFPLRQAGDYVAALASTREALVLHELELTNAGWS